MSAIDSFLTYSAASENSARSIKTYLVMHVSNNAKNPDDLTGFDDIVTVPLKSGSVNVLPRGSIVIVKKDIHDTLGKFSTVDVSLLEASKKVAHNGLQIGVLSSEAKNCLATSDKAAHHCRCLLAEQKIKRVRSEDGAIDTLKEVGLISDSLHKTLRDLIS